MKMCCRETLITSFFREVLICDLVRSCRSKLCYLFILIILRQINGQTFNVQGNVFTEIATPVKFASVTFINQSDSTSTITDTLGDYRLSVTTAIDHLDLILCYGSFSPELSQSFFRDNNNILSTE